LALNLGERLGGSSLLTSEFMNCVFPAEPVVNSIQEKLQDYLKRLIGNIRGKASLFLRFQIKGFFGEYFEAAFHGMKAIAGKMGADYRAIQLGNMIEAETDAEGTTLGLNSFPQTVIELIGLGMGMFRVEDVQVTK